MKSRIVWLAGGLLGLTMAAASCSQDASQGALRSIQSAGPLSFVCLDSGDKDLSQIPLPLSACSDSQTESPSDFSIPHLYALVTQPLRGEVAVIDLTATSNSVLDNEPSIPGTNFLPVGAMPTAIASTPGSTATFVSTAEPGFEALYALPSQHLRAGGARLSSWPSCSLPSAPSEIQLVVDPLQNDQQRPSCDSDYGAADNASGCSVEEGALCRGDLAQDALASGKPGRMKLLVTLPDEQGFAILDAQHLLNSEPGQFAPCVIERWVPLSVAIPPQEPPPAPSDNEACAADPEPIDLAARSYSPRPSGMALADNTLYVGDSSAPVIHRIDLSDPCAPTELGPLVTRSDEDPSRIVTTSKIRISPKTLDLKRYLYAIDVENNSLLVYDISDEAKDNALVRRDSAAANPFQPADRILFAEPPRDIVLLQHEKNDQTDSTSGATIPLRCDPTVNSSEPAGQYQTSTSFDSGAGPTRLRGVFGFAVMASGNIFVIDVDDYDAACRAPKEQGALQGCGASNSDGELGTSGEYSCSVSIPHQLRSQNYLVQTDTLANRPGLQNFPLLLDDEGTVLELDQDAEVPRMRATVPAAPEPIDLPVGTALRTLSPTSGLLSDDSEQDDTSQHTLAINADAPRAHIVSQSWSATYEGSLPGFQNRFAQLVDKGNGAFQLNDAGARFCGLGISSQNNVAAGLAQSGDDNSAAKSVAQADYVQIASSLAVDSDSYWTQQNQCGYSACLQTYGAAQTPSANRDLRIVEATENSLELVQRNPPAATGPALKCCFPGVVEFRVRGGNQWVVVGELVGFLHNVKANDKGVCRPSCNSKKKLLRGRATHLEGNAAVFDDAVGSFKNPFFRFAIQGGTPARGMRFRFATQGSFRPLQLATAAAGDDVQPTAIKFLATTRELAISDGSIRGVTFVNLDSLATSRQYQ